MVFDAVIVGAGFAGSLLGRILARSGWKITIIDRQRHPRFALGESSTPLANLSLERLARLYDLPELGSLSAHGRWRRAFPEVRCGLKRGFSFYLHETGNAWRGGPDNGARLLVAASPDDEVADTHWLRADVDQLFARLAVADGVELREETSVESIAGSPGRWRLSVRRGETVREIGCRLLIDASGPAGAVARRLGVGDGPRPATSSGLVYGHFRGVGELEAMVSAECRGQAPYPEERAAVHHLLDEGWMYSLRFDDGLVSAGILLADGEAAGGSLGEPAAAKRWRSVVSRYPDLERLFAAAEPVGKIGSLASVQHRLEAASGEGWVALPHSVGFVDPLFSTGIAWSLRGVERLAALLVGCSPDDPALESGLRFERYGDLLGRELEQIDRLIAAAYRVRRHFDLFAAHALLYFAVVSFAEARERLCQPDEPWWSGLLAAGEPEWEARFVEAARRLDGALEDDAMRRAHAAWVREVIAPIDVAGLAEVERRNVHPVDLSVLVANAAKLGLDREEVRKALPRLRGAGAAGPETAASRNDSATGRAR